MANIINSLTFGSGTYVITLPYATCSTAAGTAAKVATITPGSNFSLETGARVSVKFDAANSASSPTLNVNQSGAKTIRFRGAALTSSLFYWAAGSVVDFVYDGTYWNMTGSPHNYDSNTTYTFNGAVSTIKDNNLTASRALVSDTNGKVAVSAVTSTELGYLDGVTSNIQTQLNGKASSSHTHTYASSPSAGGGATSLAIFDTRDVQETPAEMITATLGSKGARLDFKQTSTVGLSSLSEGSYAAVMTVSPWGDSTNWSGGKSTQLGLTDNGKIHVRKGNGSGWDSWRTLVDNTQVSNSAPTLAWGTTSTIGTIGGTALTVKMPANPNTNTAHAHTAGTGLTVTGAGGTTGTTTYSANLNSTTSLGTIGTTSQLYAVGVDDNGKLCANVPWTDNKVAQIHASTTGTAAYPVLFSNKTVTSGTGNTTSSVGKNELLYYYPAGGRLVVGTDKLLSELHPDDSDDFVEAFPDGYGSLYVGGNLYVGAGNDAYGILPYQNNYSTIGSQDMRWWYVYATNVNCTSLNLGGTTVTATYPYFLGTRCTTTASTAAKTANAVGFSSTYFKTGATITVIFVNAHSSATAATFNLNNTGAKTIMRYGKTITSANGNSWTANGLVKLQYDGTYWQWIDETPQWNQYST